MKRIIALIGVVYCTFILFACAQPPLNSTPNPKQASIDNQYQQLAKIAREHLTEARLPDGSPVPAETPEELAKPILPEQEIKNTVDHGVRSVIMETCGLDWEKSFSDYMASQRSRKLWSAKQMAYMGLLHGLSMGFSQEPITKKGCPPEMRQALSQQLQ